MFKKIVQYIKEHSVVKKAISNSSWVIIQNITTMALGIFVTGIIARYFGPEKYGIFSYVLSITSIFSGIATVGIDHIIVKDLTNKPEKEGKILGTGLGIRITSAVILVIISEVTIFLLNGMNSTILIIGILLNSMILFNTVEVIDYYAQANLQLKYISISKIVAFILLAILKILVVVLNLSIEWFTAAYMLESIFYAIALIYSYKHIKKSKQENTKWIFDKQYCKELLSKSWYFALSAIMITLYLRIDQVMLGSLIVDKTQVGIYSVAVKIAEMWIFVPSAVISSVKPLIIQEKHEGSEKYKKRLQQLYDIVSIICIVFAIGITVFSKLIIYILYGVQYLDATVPLYIIIWGTWFGTLGNVHYVWLVCEEKEKYSIIYSLSGSIINIILNFILIPKFGMYGAAIATLASQFTANVLSFLLFQQTRELTRYAVKAILFIEPIKQIKRRVFYGKEDRKE